MKIFVFVLGCGNFLNLRDNAHSVCIHSTLYNLADYSACYVSCDTHLLESYHSSVSMSKLERLYIKKSFFLSSTYDIPIESINYIG